MGNYSCSCDTRYYTLNANNHDCDGISWLTSILLLSIAAVVLLGILAYIFYRRWKSALGVKKESKCHEVQLDRTELANQDDEEHHDKPCDQNVQYAHSISTKPGSDSFATESGATAECKSELIVDLAGVSHETLHDIHQEVV
jgi:ABC-type nickel/cobalt efflux system permease component RcnA